MQTSPTGPFVAMAVFCQRLDRQPDGTVDVVGVIDGVQLSGPEPGETDAPPVVRLLGLVSLRAGEARGRRTLSLQAHFPDGALGASLTRHVEFTDRVPGATIGFPLELEAREPGLYWFDVLCDGALLTRIPLVVEHATRDAGDFQRSGNGNDHQD
ncbi:MAG TPA: hypothetical protein VIL35_06345 [Vicinamibacterales bacterium]